MRNQADKVEERFLCLVKDSGLKIFFPGMVGVCGRKRQSQSPWSSGERVAVALVKGAPQAPFGSAQGYQIRSDPHALSLYCAAWKTAVRNAESNEISKSLGNTTHFMFS